MVERLDVPCVRRCVPAALALLVTGSGICRGGVRMAWCLTDEYASAEQPSGAPLRALPGPIQNYGRLDS